MFFVACGGERLIIQNEYIDETLSYESHLEETTPEEIAEHTSDTIYTIVETDYGTQRIFPPGTLSLEHFLEDIDYLVYVLENNFALLEVAHWARGVDIYELADNARTDVFAAYGAGELCEDMYLAILNVNFWPMFNIGHFDIFTPSRYNSMLTNPYGVGYRSPVAMRNNRLSATPLARRFYEDRVGNSGRYTELFIALAEKRDENYNHVFGTLSDDLVRTPVSSSSPVTTEITEEGHIGYISHSSFFDRSQTQIFNFYEEISGFEHLIIDLRGNGGGDINVFVNTLFGPNITEAITISSFHFFMDGPYIRKHGDDIFIRTASNGHMVIPTSYRPVSEILEEHEFADIRLHEFDRLHYGVASNTGSISPHITPFGSRLAFDGKIWMLTDSAMLSAANAATWFSMQTDFATHVGDTTGGAFGGLRTLALLPNTGIAIYFDVFYITDEHGRSLEAGIIPHHFNRPGMDALETVLALIAEGEY